MRLWRAPRGSGLVYGVLGAALLLLVVGALYDAYAMYHYRTWGYQVAGEAARMGTLQGADLDYTTGAVILDATIAAQAARQFLLTALPQQPLTAYAYDIRVITAATGGTLPGFPPVARANLDGGPMRLSQPGVGVYLVMQFPTAWLGLLSRDAYQVHVFSAAQVSEIVP